MNRRLGLIAGGTVIAMTLAVLPGCKWLFDMFKKDKSAKTAETEEKKGPLLLSVNNEPVLWESDFNKSLNQMLQANPYFRGAGIDKLPLAIKKRFFDELVKQELILDDAKKKQVVQRADFVKAYDELKKLAKRSLVIQFYEKDIYDGIEVNDKEKEKFFGENKDRFVKVAGGVLAAGYKCATDLEADTLVKQVKTSKILDNEKDFIQEFEKLVKKTDKAKIVKNFGRIGEKGGEMGETAPAPIKETVFALKKLPAVEKVKVGKEIWVVAAADKQASVLFSKEEVDAQITNILKNNKFRDELDKKIKDLRGAAKIDMNEVYFKEEQKAVAPAAGSEVVELTKKQLQEAQVAAQAKAKEVKTAAKQVETTPKPAAAA